jgi:lysophospholipase L1-like esterase
LKPAGKRLNPILLTYLVLVHALLGLALAKSDLLPKVTDKLIETGLIQSSALSEPEHECMTMMKRVHGHMDRFVPSGATVFLGDSLTMSLATSALAPFAINYGIGGQRSDQLIKSMDLYGSMARAGTVVIAIGTNDLLQAQEEGIGSRYRAILEKIPPNVRVVMSSVPPIGDVWRRGRHMKASSVRDVVSVAEESCRSDSRCIFVDAYTTLTKDGTPLPDVLDRDGVHLSPHGYELWMSELRIAIANVQR